MCLELFAAATQFINLRNVALKGVSLEGEQVWLIAMEVWKRVNDQLMAIIDFFWL